MKTKRFDYELPYRFNNEGHCRWCNGILPKKRKRWCSDKCGETYLREKGWYYRDYAIQDNIKQYGILTCVRCGKKPLKEHHNIRDADDLACADYIVPLSVGGSCDPNNLQILCNICDQAKNEGHCRWCNGILPKRRKRLCSAECCEVYFREKEWHRRYDAIQDNIKQSGILTCVRCGRKPLSEHHTIGDDDDLACADHIVPLSAGGSRSDPNNLQILCNICHKAKTWKEYNEWNHKWMMKDPKYRKRIKAMEKMKQELEKKGIKTDAMAFWF